MGTKAKTMEEDLQEEPWSFLAGTLASFDHTEKDDVSLDVREQFQFRPEPEADERFPTTPLHRGQKYLKIKGAVQAHLQGQIDKLTFLNTIRPLALFMGEAVKVMETPKVEERFAKLSEDEYEAFQEMHRCFTLIQSGLERMLSYKEHDNRDDLQPALEFVTQAYTELHQVQDDIVEIGQSKSE